MYPNFLIADDERDALKLVQEILGKHFPGSKITTARNGMEAVEKARAQRPDIILLDAKMPHKTGFDVCRELKSDPSMSGIPVIIYTGYYGDPYHRQLGLDSGADGYLCKPFEDTELVFLIKALLRARQAEARYRAIIEDQTDLICRWEAGGQLTFVNTAYARYFGREPNDLIGKDFFSLIPEEAHASVKTHIASLSADNPVITYEHPAVDSSGQVRWQQWCDRGFFDKEERLLEVQSVGRDVTTRRQMETQLRDATAAAEAADHAKSALLAGMSHELRTPLNAVIGFSQVLQEGYFGELNQKQREYVDDILGGGQQLLRLVDSVLDIANIDTTKGGSCTSPVQIADVLEDSLCVVRERAAKRGITLKLADAPSLRDLDVSSDELRIRQSMFVLLANAVKFTPDNGSVTVSAEATEHEVTVTVSDTGIGMEKQHLEKVFDDFYQVENSRLGKTAGMGLGLSLVRRLVDLLGGRIWAESEGSGRGSRFIFTLPLTGSPTDAT